MQHNSWKRDKELLSEAYGQLSSSDWDDMDPSVTGQGGDFPPLEKGQLVWVDYNDGSQLTGVLDFDGDDLARSNTFTLDGGKSLGVENIVDIGIETSAELFDRLLRSRSEGMSYKESLSYYRVPQDKWKSIMSRYHDWYNKKTGGNENEEDDGNVLERLEAFMNSHPETVEGLRQIIIDFEDIIDDINRLGAEDGTIDAADLGIHLARLAPDTTKGSAL